MYIREMREKEGLTQEALAEAMECHVNTIRRWETGKREPKASELSKLAKILRCSEGELLNGPSNGKTKIVLSYDWNEYEEGDVNMDGKLFKLFLGDNGQIGAKGSTLAKSRAEFEEFKANLIQDLEDMFELQEKRLRRVGIQPA